MLNYNDIKSYWSKFYADAFEEGFEDMMHRQPDLTKIKNFIGWEPKHKLDHIISRIIDYYEK